RSNLPSEARSSSEGLGRATGMTDACYGSWSCESRLRETWAMESGTKCLGNQNACWEVKRRIAVAPAMKLARVELGGQAGRGDFSHGGIGSIGVRYSSLLSPSVTRTAQLPERSSGRTTRSSFARLSALSIAISLSSRIIPPWLLKSLPMTRSKLKYG